MLLPHVDPARQALSNGISETNNKWREMKDIFFCSICETNLKKLEPIAVGGKVEWV